MDTKIAQIKGTYCISWSVQSFSKKSYYPTGPFAILEPNDQDKGKLYVVKERRTTDFEALKL